MFAFRHCGLALWVALFFGVASAVEVEVPPEFSTGVKKVARQAEVLKSLVAEANRVKNQQVEGVDPAGAQPVVAALMKDAALVSKEIQTRMGELGEVIGSDAEAKDELEKLTDVVDVVLKDAQDAAVQGNQTESKDISQHEFDGPEEKSTSRCLKRNREACAADGKCFFETSFGVCLRNCTDITGEERCNNHPACHFDEKGDFGGCQNDCFLRDFNSGAFSAFTCGNCHSKQSCKVIGKLAYNATKQQCQWVEKALPDFPSDRCINIAAADGFSDAQFHAFEEVSEEARIAAAKTAVQGACGKPTIHHGGVMPNKELFAPGEFAQIVCSGGFQPSDVAAKVQCDPKGSGEFSPVVMCVGGRAGRLQRQLLGAMVVRPPSTTTVEPK